MQQCGICLKVYDESEYAHCPYCDGTLIDDDDDYDEEEDEDEEEDVLDEHILEFRRILSYPGIYDDEGEFIRCPNCGHGLRDVNGTRTCPECGPV